MSKVKYKAPKGYAHAMAYLRVADAEAALDFYAKAFDAKEKYRLTMGDRIGHAELEFGDSRVMLSDTFPEMGVVSPKELGNTPVAIVLHVADSDALFERALAAGATVKRPLQDEFYGYRSGQLLDPFGHVWMIQTHIEHVSHKKMQKRLDAMMSGAAPETTPAKPATARKPKRSPRKV